ncbi:MAG: glycosyltransferase family 4 protein [Anaerolineae bacterium]|nr:glycosyltransferase family 4 protein [Anaerolineae bacterium]
MKVTFLTGEYPPMQGGIADHTACLAEHLIPLGVESSILIGRYWQDAAHEVNISCLPFPAHIHPVLPNWGWRCWPGVVHFLKKHQPDVLHIQYQAAAFDLGGWVNWLPWYFQKRNLKTRIVTTFHDLRVPYIFPKAGSFRWRSMLALARHSHAVICTNRQDLYTLQTALNIEPSSSAPRLAHIPLGSNVEPQPPADFDRPAWRKKYQITAETLLLAYFGFLNQSKGGEELIEALALLRQQGIDARLLLIGGEMGHADPTNAAYAQKVQTLIDRHCLAGFIYRTGYVGLPEVSANLLAADVVVMPYRDGVSFRRTTLIAALRHGCPVVSTFPTDASLVPEIKPGENMLLVQPRNARALAGIISPLAQDHVLRQKLSQGVKVLGGLFEWNNIARHTTELYRTLKIY